MPGQATAYMAGREAINRIRSAARAELGDKFDIRGFHDAVLANGACALIRARNNCEVWVEKQKQ